MRFANSYLSMLITASTSKPLILRCYEDGSDRARVTNMLTFRQWLAKPIKSIRKKNDPRQPSQGSTAIGVKDEQREVIGNNKEIHIGGNQYIPEPK